MECPMIKRCMEISGKECHGRDFTKCHFFMMIILQDKMGIVLHSSKTKIRSTYWNPWLWSKSLRKRYEKYLRENGYLK